MVAVSVAATRFLVREFNLWREMIGDRGVTAEPPNWYPAVTRQQGVNRVA